MAVIFAIILIIASVFIHYEALWRLNRFLPQLHIVPRRASVAIAMLGAMASHLVQILLFALVYHLIPPSLGGIMAGNKGDLTFLDFLYFSMETYTSLGFGDIIPIGGLRLLIGIESITGLLMISWTASFTYLEMQKYWGDKDTPKRP